MRLFKKSFSRSTIFISLAIMAALLFAACSTGPNDETTTTPPVADTVPRAYMRYKLDGVQKICDTTHLYVQLSDSIDMFGEYSGYVIGTDSLNWEESMDVAFNSLTPIHEGQVFPAVYLDFDNNVYTIGADLTYQYQPKTYFSTAPTNLLAPICTCTLTKITPTYIQGTFSGNVFSENEWDRFKFHITEGEFCVKRQ